MEVRLQKILAERGICSRRAAEKMILEGRIKVNGVKAELGTKADPEIDEITISGNILKKKPDNNIYLILFKPSGYICSAKDEKNRRTVLDLIPITERVYPVGRLDYNTSGLLLITNDGVMTNALLHPKGLVPKSYQCAVKGNVNSTQLEMLQNGIHLTDGVTAPAKAEIKKAHAGYTVIEITIHEGKNRQVRRMMAALGFDVMWLRRAYFAGLSLDGLKPGEWRYLTEAEIAKLNELVTTINNSQEA